MFATNTMLAVPCLLILLWTCLRNNFAYGQSIHLTRVRSIDGREHVDAMVGAQLLRFPPKNGANYSDGVGEMRVGPNPRTISNLVFAQDGYNDGDSLINRAEQGDDDQQHSDMVWAWGQFLDHDISLSRQSSKNKGKNNGAHDIKIRDKRDTLYPKIKFKRSDYVVG
ncbi:hypothetical protein ACA910_002669 [Epithemia clementina (nom. ined.)]